MNNPNPPMKSTDPRFKKRIEALQIKLGFTGDDVDGSIGHNTLTRIENRIFNYTTPDEAVGTGGNPGTGNAADEGSAVPPVNPGGTPAAGASTAGNVDDRSAKNIATLLAPVRPLFERIAIEGTRIAKEMGATGYVMISGTRTYAEQDALYAKGRTAPGSKVTNAKGGYSNHNFGIAGDFGVFSGSSYLDNTNAALASKIHKAVAAWVKANLPQIEWGGDWTSFRDEPHYQYKTGLSLAQMRARVAAGQSVIA